MKIFAFISHLLEHPVRWRLDLIPGPKGAGFINKFNRVNGGGRNFIVLCLFLLLVFFWSRPDVLAAAPDLVPKNNLNQCGFKDCIAYIGDFREGSSISLWGEIANLGDANIEAAGPVKYGRFQIDLDNNGSIDLVLEQNGYTPSPFNVGQSYNITSDTPWLLTRGVHRVIYCVDVYNFIAESDETNNCVEEIFDLSPHTLFITKSGTGSGTISSNPAGLDCGSDCSELYAKNMRVLLNNDPDNNSTFAGWSGDSECSGSFVMNSDKTCNAIFEIAKGFVQVKATWRGSPWQGELNYIITGPDVILNMSSVESVFSNKPIGLYSIVYVSGGPSGGGQPIISPLSSLSIVESNHLITFQFNFDPPTVLSPFTTLTITKTGVGLGTVISAPAGLDCGATCSADFNKGDEVVLTAAPATNHGFIGWSGACSGQGACAVTMDTAKNVTATFVSPPNPPSNLSWSCAP